MLRDKIIKVLEELEEGNCSIISECPDHATCPVCVADYILKLIKSK